MRTAFASVTLVLLLALVPTNAQQACPAVSTTPCFADGLAQPVFQGQPTITHDVWVEVPDLDTDRDSLTDRIRVQIVRPVATEFGTRLSVVLAASPYFAGTKPYHTYDITGELYAPDAACHENGYESEDLPTVDPSKAYAGNDPAAGLITGSSYQSYFLPRGFIFAYANSLGTGSSTGCPTIGGVEENLAIKAVIDWFNGSGTASDATGAPVQAYWTNGATTMIGVSYDGTLPIGAATLGIGGLKAIVPIAGVSSYYDHRRSYGGVSTIGDSDSLFVNVLTRKSPQVCDYMRWRIARATDRQTGDYNPFWDERNYYTEASMRRFATPVLISHGLNDHNVKMRHAARLWAALKTRGVPAKIWLNQGGHGDRANSVRQAVWRDTLNRFWSHFLYGVDNGAMDGPKATVERENGVWVDYADWPAPGSTTTTLYAGASGDNSVGRLGADPPPPGRPVVETLIDDSTINAAALVAAAQSPNRLVYQTTPLTASVHVSGTPEVSLRLSFNKPGAVVSAMVVDYKANGTRTIVTRGWADPQNRKSLTETFAIDPGRPYTIRFELQPHDYIFQPGSRIGFVVLSSDWEGDPPLIFTLRPPPGTWLTLETTSSTLLLPVVGGSAALVAAGAR